MDTLRASVVEAMGKAPWFPFRIMQKFGNAIMEQSEHSDSPNQRSSSMISYCVSPFAAICMTTAIFLNRIMVFASSSSMTRNRTKLPLVSRVFLRLIAIYLLFDGSYGALVALKLKFDDKNGNAILRFLLSSSYFDYKFDEFKEMKFLGVPYFTKSFLDFNQLNNNNMDYLALSPSPSIMKPLYMSLCIGQVLETFIALTNGSDPLVENGLTLFEYSLLFQEVQSAGIPSYELLVISMVAIVNQMVIHVLGLFELQRYRLIPSSIVGSYVLYFYFMSFIRGRLLWFPFIVVMGYLPQLLTFFIIVLCVSIFMLLLIFKGSFRDLEFSKIADNLSSINILMTDDFYTALTNVGTFMITAAGKSSYVKEISDVKISRRTWLEDDQLQDKNSFIAKIITGYGNQVDVLPELQELRDKNLKIVGGNSNGNWLYSRRLYHLKKLIVNFKQLLTSLITKKPPKFLKDEYSVPVGDIVSDVYLSIDEEEDDEDYDLESEDLVSEFGEDDDENDESVLQELILSPEDLLTLVTTEPPVGDTSPPLEMSSLDLRILRAHLLKNDDTVITRSKFNSNTLEPSNKLLDLIMEKRLHKPHHHDVDEGSDSDEDDLGLPDCVICQGNPREIILWPCKCLAICESCRVSLIVRGFNDCVCCRRKVELYSKVFIP